MNAARRCAPLAALFLLTALAAPSPAQQGGAQPKPEDGPVGRYKIFDFPVGKFVYRFLFDSATADHWLWVNGEWERPEQAKGGVPWKGLEAKVGRFQFLAQIPGELDLELYVMDTVTGRMWSRPARNRAQLFVAEEWREIAPPRRPKKD